MSFAYTLAGMKIFGSLASAGGKSIHFYGTPNNPSPDPIGTILNTANYFSAAGYLLEVGDQIQVIDSAGLSVTLEVLSNSNMPIPGAGSSSSPPAPTPGGTVVVVPVAGNLVYEDPTDSASAATGGTQQLKTFILPASFFQKVGQRLKLRAVFALAANANNKQVGLAFGSTSFLTAAAATNAKNAIAEMEVVRTGTSTQRVTATALVDTTWTTPSYTAATESETAAITLAAQVVAATGASDAIVKDFEVLRLA